MSNLLQAMTTIKEVFDEHAKADKRLNKQEMAELLRKEFGMGPGKCDEADKMFNMLDHDKSQSIDFQEFVTFVASLCVIIME